MEVSFKTADLKKYLPIVKKAVETKTTTPILSQLFILASGTRAVIQATDMDNHLSVVVPCSEKAKFKSTVPAELFCHFVEHTQEETITLEPLDNYNIRLKAGNKSAVITTMKTDNWPTFAVPPSDYPLLIPSPRFADLVSKVNFSIAREESRYVLNGVLLNIEKDNLEMVATDGIRLSCVATKDFNFQSHKEYSAKIMIRSSTLSLLKDIASQSEHGLAIAEQDGTLFFSCGPFSVSSKKLTGQFPYYRAVIPKRLTAPTVTVDAKVLLEALIAAEPFADQRINAATLQVNDSSLNISSCGAETGKFSCDIPANCSARIRIGFNSQYLQDLCSAVTGDIAIEFQGPEKAGLFVPVADNGDFLYVVMPIRM